MTNPVNMLMILDGWGINENLEGNAAAQAKTPFLDRLKNEYPSCRLLCSGGAVGLPDGTMGNSEVGHMNIGAGRIVPQDFVRINMAIEDKTFETTPALVNIMQAVKEKDQTLHLMGLLSDGGVHSHISHLFALIEAAKIFGIKDVQIHAIMDGRDTSPTSGSGFIKDLETFLSRIDYGRISTITGRFWAMDRDTRWDRVQKAYQLYTQGKGDIREDPLQAVQNAYKNGQTDEFITPILIGKKDPSPAGPIADGDGIVFFNFRADRAKEITRAFTQKAFHAFERETVPRLCGFVCMTQYDETFDLPAAFGPQHLNNILGEVLSKNGISQLRIAETEKYAHVTYFFNGGDENVFEKEERILIPSPRDVATYDLKPAMSAPEVADKACEQIRSEKFGFIVLNFANMDMVGHTGIIEAAVTACETVDACVEKVLNAIWETGGTAVVTADHGNCEQMIAPDGSPHTAHTLNPVPLIVAGNRFKGQTIKDGKLGDIAPTFLKILSIPQPDEMTGTSLI